MLYNYCIYAVRTLRLGRLRYELNNYVKQRLRNFVISPWQLATVVISLVDNVANWSYMECCRKTNNVLIFILELLGRKLERNVCNF